MEKSKKSNKKVLITVLCVILAIIIAAGLYIAFGVVKFDEQRTYRQSESVNANASDSGVTVLDENVTYQTMNGFGASSCWWSQDVGGWENSEEIMKALYDNDEGIGLNIYRYNLGAGSKGDEHIQIENRATESFLNDDGTYNWDNDQNAQNCLALAQKYAGEDMRVTLFCNSAPVSMTKNGAAYCSPYENEDDEWVSNLDASNYESFAEYCYNCASHFVDEGYRVTDVSPINEPQYNWAAWYNDDGSYAVNQEGCYYSKYEARDLLNVFVDKFADSELDEQGVKVSMFESGAMDGDDSTCAAYMDCILGKGPKYVFKNIKLRDYFTNVSMHSYWSSSEAKQNAADYISENYSNYDISSTEYCQMTEDENTGVYDLIQAEEDGTNGTTIAYGVAMAQTIIDDLTIMNVNEWDWWTACSYGVYTDALIYLDEDDHDNIEYSKRYWCLGNFSKFIEEGATRVACSDGAENVESVAFVNEDNSTVVVYVNSGESETQTTLTADGEYEVYTTDKDNDLARTAFGDAGEITVSLPADSVVTVIYK